MSSWYWHRYTVYSNALDIVFHVNICYTRHCHFISMYHCYTNTVHKTRLFYDHVSLTHWPLLQHVPGYYYFIYCITVTRSQFLHVLVPTLHGYSRTRDSVIACEYLLYWTLLLHVLVDLLHGSCIAPIL